MNTVKKQSLIKLFEIGLFLILGIMIVIFFSQIIPLNMDEFLFYHTIACSHYPHNALNTFREGCHVYDLNILNTNITAMLRSYYYVGSFPAIYYYPLFIICKNPFSARFLGMIFLLIQSFVLGKVFKIKPLYLYVGLICFFPYFFQHLVDTGPIGFQATSVIVLYALFKEWFKTLKLYIPILISLIIFFCIWIKLVYFWLLPGIICLFLFELWLNKQTVLVPGKRKIFYTQVLACIALVIMLCSAFIYSSNPGNPNDRPLLNQMLGSQSYTFQEFFNSNWLNLGIIKAYLNPLEATKRIYEVTLPSYITYFYDILIYLSIPLILLFLYRKNPQCKKEILLPAVFYLLFLLTAFFILRTKASYWMHHAILAFPFLVLSAISTISILLNKQMGIFPKILVFRWLVIFVLLNSFFFLTFSNQPLTFKGENDFSRITLNKLLNNSELSKKYFYVVIDWGMYYYQSLYGQKEQSVLYMEPLVSIDQINQLKYLSQAHNRKIIFIYNAKSPSSNMPLIHSSFSLKRWDKIDESSVWQILIETI